MSRRYADYLSIPEDYSPAMTREVFEEHPDAWMSFLPHPKFVELLRAFLNALCHAQRSVWTMGNYGTGKSFAVLTIRMLFLDTEDRVRAWFAKHRKVLPPELLDTILALRQRGVLFVYDYNADGLDPHKEFLVRLERHIVDALQDAGKKIPPRTQLSTMLERIREEGDNFFKTRDEIQSRLPALHPGIATIEQLEAALTQKEIPEGLLADIQQVLYARSIYLEISAVNLKNWMQQAAAENGLEKIVYVFDEFSSFIDANKAELKTFEQVAEYSELGLFYFVPVTHMSIDAYWAEGSANPLKSNERFDFQDLQMPDDTAFRLVGNAIEVNPALEKEWRAEKAQLWSAVSDFAGIHLQGDEVSRESLQAILPLHPMAAFLLKYLCTSVGSDQRSLFEYLKGGTNEKTFQKFLREGGPDVPGKQFLTADYLWSYFLGQVKQGTKAEVEEIRAAFQRIRRREFANRDEDDEEIRVLKVVLLFSLLDRLYPEGHELLRPTITNVELAFKGDGAIVGVRGIVRHLADRQCFSLVGENIELFRSSVGGAELEKRVAEFENKFHKLLSDKLLKELEKSLPGPALRYTALVADVTHLKAGLLTADSRRSISQEDGKVLVCFVPAKNREEQLAIPERIQNFLKHYYDHRLVCVSFPDVTFCSENANAWKDYVHAHAQEVLANDDLTKSQYSHTLEKMAQSWIGRIQSKQTSLLAFCADGKDACISTPLSWDNFDAYLSNYVSRNLPLCLEQLVTANLVIATQTSGLAPWAKAGLLFENVTKGSSAQLVSFLRKQGVASDDAWFDGHPEHPLARLRAFFQERVASALQEQRPFSLRQAFQALKRPPYGMLPYALTAFAFGFALRFLLSRGYQWTNGQGTWPLDTDSLAAIINDAVKGSGNGQLKNEQRICEISPEERQFVTLVPRIFGLQGDPNGTVEEALNKVAQRIEAVSCRVPLWVLPEYDALQAEPDAEPIGRLVGLLCQAFLISSKSDVADRTNCAREIGRMLLQEPALADRLSPYVRAGAFQSAFRQYIDREEPALGRLARRVGDRAGEYCGSILAKASEAAGWLWKKTDIHSAAAEVSAEYEVVAQVQKLAHIEGFLPYPDALAHLYQAAAEKNRLPRETLLLCYPELAEFLRTVGEPAEAGIAPQISAALSRSPKRIKEVFFSADAGAQLAIIRERLAKSQALPDDRLRGLYYQSDSGFFDREQAFFSDFQRRIDECLKTEAIGRLSEEWKAFSGSASPDDWAAGSHLPAWTLFERPEDAQEILGVLQSPRAYTAEKLEDTLSRLSGQEARAIPRCQQAFFQRMVPRRYRRFDIGLASLLEYMNREYGARPNRWPLDADITPYIEGQYQAAIAPRIVNELKNTPSDRLKQSLLRFAAENPDIGLAFWESIYDHHEEDNAQ